MFTKRLKTRTAILALVAAACVVGLVLGLYFGLRSDGNDSSDWISDSGLGVYKHAAVTTNGYPCAKIGSDILKRNGSAVEAAIAALFCEGVVCLQSMGIGGGFLMTIYSRQDKRVETLNARETAPADANEDMYGGNSTLSQFGGLAVAVPGELKGYREAYEKYKSGRIPWKDLITPSIALCEEGIVITPYLANTLKNNKEAIGSSRTLRDMLFNNITGDIKEAGDLIKRPKLAKTLELIANEGVDIFYNGALGEKFVDDVKELGGIIKMEDLQSYTVKWEKPITAKLRDNITLYSTPLPGSGILLSFILQILNDYIPTENEVTTYQRITESFKYGYGKRTELGDTDFIDIKELLENLTSSTYATQIRNEIEDFRTWSDPEHYGAVLAQPNDGGTAHISVLAPNGDAVSVTSTINLILGAMEESKQTGIILNNEMDDFSAPNITNAFGIPPSPNNFIEPGKRPLSSMCPTIFVDDKGDVRLVVGAAGGTKITTATALVSMFNLWFDENIKQAIDAPRIHHQLFPMTLQYEEGFPNELVEGLHTIGHNTSEFPVGGSSVTGITCEDGVIYANADLRRNGVTAGF